MKTLKTKIKEVVVRMEGVNEFSFSEPITSQEEAVALVRGYIGDDMEVRENFVVLYLSRSGNPIGIFRASVGHLHACLVDPKIVVGTGVSLMASSAIVYHNHPSGNLNPSLADENITKKLFKAFEFFDITLLEHIVVTTYGHREV